MQELRRVVTGALLCGLFASISLAAATSGAPAGGDSNPGDLVKMLRSTKAIMQVAISPDGKRVGWVEEVPGGGDTIFIAENRPGAEPKRISAAGSTAPGTEDSIAWAPDGRSLAFLSDAGNAGKQQLYVIGLADSSARKLTNAKGVLASPKWSPDGKTIAVLFIENADRAAGPLVAETVHTGVIKEAITEQRLALVDVAGGKMRQGSPKQISPKQISPNDMYVYEYNWSPDSKRFVTTAARGNGDNNWYIAQIYVLDADGGEMKSISKPPLQIAYPTWSPDGNSVAFIGGLMSDEGVVGGDIFVLPASGGEPKNITPNRKASANWLQWREQDKILVGEQVQGGSGIATVSVESQKVDSLFQTSDQITGNGWGTSISISSDGQSAAMVRHSSQHPPEVWAGAMNDWKQITSRNTGLKPLWGEAKSIHWVNDGFDIQGWLFYPWNFDPGKRYPLVVQAHGGPSSMARPGWPDPQNFAVALSNADYFVLLPNPRGSYGQGEAFTRANVKDFGYGDFRDIMAGVDTVLNTLPIDEHRLGITGWSYGGYMTMWAVTQTNRFAAAVAGAGLANLQSYYGENQIDQWMIPFFGASVYDDPQVYAKSSPITYIKNVKTPTLVLVGDSDGECPTPQSYEFWHALKTLGVETELVVYEHEGHHFAKPEHQRDVVERLVAWFDKRLK